MPLSWLSVRIPSLLDKEEAQVVVKELGALTFDLVMRLRREDRF